MSAADVLWTLLGACGIVGFCGLVDEVFPKFWPAVWRFTRRRYWCDRNRRHPIIKDWK